MLELKLGVCSITFCDILNLSIQKSIQQTSYCNYTIVTEICQLLKITLHKMYLHTFSVKIVLDFHQTYDTYKNIFCSF